MLHKNASKIILLGIFIGIIIGGLSGWIFGEKMLAVAWLGTLFLNALKMIVVPLVICSIVSAMGNIGDIGKVEKAGAKTILYYMATTAIAVVIGMILVNIIKPGTGIESLAVELPEKIRSKESFSFIQVILGLVPSNIFKSMVEMKILPLIFVSLIFGGVLITMGDKGKPAINLFEIFNVAIMKIVHLIMWFAPIGVFGIVAGRIAAVGGGQAFLSELTKVMKYAITVVLGLGIHGFFVLPLILFLFSKRNPFKYAYKMLPALATAFSTASSSATLPVTTECVEEENNVSPKAASLVLPLGATINMDGTAMYEAVAAIFIAQLYGIDLSIPQQIMIFLTATLASIGAAGIPEAGLVTMVLVLKAVNLPLEGIGAILMIDWFLDRCRTTVNVWGDSVGAAVIERVKEFRNLKIDPRL